MEELIKRTEAIDHLSHFGKFDPNLIIYQSYLEGGHGEKAKRFLTYRQNWESIRQEGQRSEFPLHVAFALSNTCNLSCTHCYRTYNPDKTQKDYLFYNEVCRIIDECKRVGVSSILLGAESEMYMYKEINKVIQYISKKDFEDLWLCTNGTLLNARHIETILNSSATRLSISIDAMTLQTYRKVRGKSFYQLMTNIFNFLNKRERNQQKLPVLRLTFVRYKLNENECDDFVAFWSKIAEEVDVQPLIDIKNVNELKYKTVKKANCNYPETMLYIRWDGEFKPCCSEFCKHIYIGNIKDMSLIEAWNSPVMESLRRQFRAEEPLNNACINCLRSLKSNAAYSPIAMQL